MRKLLRTIIQSMGLLKAYRRIVRYKLPYYRYLQYKTLKEIKTKNVADIVYFTFSLPMWRYQGVYNKLKGDNRFKQTVVIYSPYSYTKAECINNQNKLVSYFKNNSVNYVLLDELNPQKTISDLRPDILFFDQPYSTLPVVDIANDFYRHKLLVYLPYCLYNSKAGAGWRYNNLLQNYAWRLYYATEFQREAASLEADNNGDNIVIVGEPHADDFKSCIESKAWKGSKEKKRIIWAPHFQIVPNAMSYRPSFLWTFDYMLYLAQSRAEELQIAFKPHPKLYSKLCKHPDWGEQRAKNYYDKWSSMPNTQLETGEFVDLFIGSDALIHDCGSFTSEYMFVKKPCLYLSKEPQEVYNTLDDFGKVCFDLHDIASNTEQITLFIDKIVKGEPDTKSQGRIKFYNEYLLPPHNKSVAQNIYDDIVYNIFK